MCGDRCTVLQTSKIIFTYQFIISSWREVLYKRTTEVSDHSSSLILLVRGHHLLDLSYRFPWVQALRGGGADGGLAALSRTEREITRCTWAVACIWLLQMCASRLPWDRSWCSSWWCGSGKGRKDPAAWTGVPLWIRLVSRSSNDMPVGQQDTTHKRFIRGACFFMQTS